MRHGRPVVRKHGLQPHLNMSDGHVQNSRSPLDEEPGKQLTA